MMARERQDNGARAHRDAVTRPGRRDRREQEPLRPIEQERNGRGGEAGERDRGVGGTEEAMARVVWEGRIRGLFVAFA